VSDHSIIAAADQAHAEAEHTLTKLITWWTQNRPELNRTDEIAALTYILATISTTNYSALLATAITRLADKADQ
jgi:hypothetical protein